MELVAFDLDGTLTDRDVFREFIVRIRPPMQRLAALADVGRYGLGLMDNAALKQSILRRWFRSGAERERTVEEAVAAAATSAFPEVIAWLRGYQRDGYPVVVATGSPRFLAQPVLERLGLEQLPLLATEASWDGDELSFRSCHGAAKLERLREAYPDTELGLVVSDSEVDRPAMAAARAWVMVSGGQRGGAEGSFPGAQP